MITSVNFESFINSNTLSENTELNSVAMLKNSYYQAGFRHKGNLRIPNKFEKQAEIDQYKKSVKDLVDNFYERPLSDIDKLLMRKIINEKGYRSTLNMEVFHNAIYEDDPIQNI